MPPPGHRGTLGWCGPVGVNRPPHFRSRVHAPPGIAFHRVGVASLGQMARWHFNPMSMPRMGIASRRVSAAPLEPLEHHGSNPMPCRGIAYQPRVQTLGIHPEKETRVLKERRIAACLEPRPRAHPMRRSSRTRLFSRMRFLGRCPETKNCLTWESALAALGSGGG